MDLWDSTCTPTPSLCPLVTRNGTLSHGNCGLSGWSTVAKEVMVFDGEDVRVYANPPEGMVVRGGVAVHTTPQHVLVSLSGPFSRAVCEAVELKRRGVAFHVALDDDGSLSLWYGGVMVVVLTGAVGVDVTSTPMGVAEGVAKQGSVFSFDGTHLVNSSGRDALMATQSRLYASETLSLCSNDRALNSEVDSWITSQRPQFEIKVQDPEQSVLLVGGESVVGLAGVHVIGTRRTEHLRYVNGTLVVEAGTQTTTTVTVPSVARLWVLPYGGHLPNLFEQATPGVISGGGLLYVGGQGVFYCTSEAINAAVGKHLTAKTVAMAMSLSLFSITISTAGREGAVAQLFFDGTRLLELKGDSIAMVLMSGDLVVYQDRTLSVQGEGSAVPTQKEGVATFYLFDGFQLLTYTGSGPSVVVPGGILYIEGSTSFYTGNSLLVAQIANALKDPDSTHGTLTPAKTCPCRSLETTPLNTTPTYTPEQVASSGSLVGSIPGQRATYPNDPPSSEHVSCDLTCSCVCSSQRASLVQGHKGLKGKQGPNTGTGIPPLASSNDSNTSAQAIGRERRSDVPAVTWVNSPLEFEITSLRGEVVLYLNGTWTLSLTRARRISIPADCSLVFGSSTLQVYSPAGRVLHWYGNVQSLVAFSDASPEPSSSSPAPNPIPGGGQLFVDADGAFYSLSDALSARLMLQSTLPSLSSVLFVSFRYTLNGSKVAVSLLARGREVAVVVGLDDVAVMEVRERPTVTLRGGELLLLSGNASSSFSNVALLAVTDGNDLCNYTDVQLSVEPGVLVVWGGGALYSSSAVLNEHISQLVLNDRMSQPCISTIATVQKGVVRMLLHGNPVAEINPQNGDTCVLLAAEESFLFANGSVVSESFAFRGVETLKVYSNCTVRNIYQSNVTFPGPGELCVTVAGGVFYFVLPSPSSLHDAYLHVVAQFGPPSLATPSFPTTFVTTSGTVASVGQGVGIFAGLHLTLLCTVTGGHPQPEIAWTLNGNSLGGRFGDGKYVVDGPRSALTIFGVDQNDGGEYRCKATNIRGSAQAQSVLTVLAAGGSICWSYHYGLPLCWPYGLPLCWPYGLPLCWPYGLPLCWPYGLPLCWPYGLRVPLCWPYGLPLC